MRRLVKDYLPSGSVKVKMELSSLLFSALAIFVVAYTIVSIHVSLRHRAKARALGCKPPVSDGQRRLDPSGILRTIDAHKASKKLILLDFLEEQRNLNCERIGRPVGTVVSRVAFFRDAIVTTEPKNIQAILATQFKDFGLGPSRLGNFKPLLGHGIFASNGARWQHSRALLRPQFVRNQVSDLDLEATHVEALFQVLDPHKGPDRWTDLVDLQPLFFRLTLDTATEFLFGESVNSQLHNLNPDSPGAKDTLRFAYAFDRSQYIMSVCGRFGPHYWIGHTREFKGLVQEVHDFVERFVNIALQRRKSMEKTAAQDGKYVFLHALAEDTQDPEELRSEILNILLAGRDTTASLLGWFFFDLAKKENAHYFQKLRAIILEDFGTASAPKEITFERLKACQFLQWCVNEALRLHPVVPLNARTAQVDTTLPVGGGPDGLSPVYVKKGQDVAYSVHLMHRRTDIWGPDAGEFRPDRWRDRRPGWDYLPFNGGPRICIGQQFALTEISYVVVRMLQRIDGIDGSSMGPIRHNQTLTNCPGEGVNVRLHFAE